MPWWAILYFIVFGCFIAAWVKDELSDRPERPYLVVELLSEMCLVLVALAYWLSPLRSGLASVAAPLFVLGCAWLVVASAREFRRFKPDPELTPALSVVSVVTGVGLYLLLSGPLFYWGFSYAVLGKVAGT
jgi:hypothetical protein